MVCLTTLLDSARDAGLTWYTEGSRLIVSGPRSAGDIGKQVLGRKIEVLAMITTPAAN